MTAILKWGLVVTLLSILFSNEAVYFCLALTIFLYLFSLLIKRTTCSPGFVVSKRYLQKQISLTEYVIRAYLFNAWWLLILTWVYGFSLALLLDVPFENAQRNFFGLLAYIIFPLLLYSRINEDQVVEIVMIAAWGIILFLIFRCIDFFSQNQINLNNMNSFSEIRFAHSIGALELLPILALNFATLLFKKNWMGYTIKNILCRVLMSKYFTIPLIFLIIVPSVSKGLFLAILILFIISLSSALLINIRRGFLPKYIFYMTPFFIFLITMLPDVFWELLFSTFDSRDIANSTRTEQADYLINEFSFWGSGLGSTLKSGYLRDTDGYGFELTYLNIIHKLGVFCLPLFISYLASFLLIVILILKRNNLFYVFFALGCLGFLIVGAGNAVLLSPISVVLHCFAIFVLLNSNRIRSSESISYNQRHLFESKNQLSNNKLPSAVIVDNSHRGLRG
jgi:hypothetical protein